MSIDMMNRRRVLAFCITCTLVFGTILFTNIGSSTSTPLSIKKSKGSTHSSPNNSFFFTDGEDPENHSQDWTKDFNRYGLTAIQCSSEFSSLFHEIERAVAHRYRIGKVKESDINLDWKSEGAVRAMIYNQKVPLPNISQSNVADLVPSCTFLSQNLMTIL